MKYNRFFQGYYGRIAVVCLAGIFILVFLWWLYGKKEEIISVLSPFLAAFFLAYILGPLVDYLENKGMSRLLSVLLLYSCIILLFYLFISAMLPSFMEDLHELVERMPGLVEKVQDFLEILQEDYRRFNLPPAAREIVDENLEGMQDWLVTKMQSSYAFIFDIFNLIFALLLVPVLAFYILYDARNLKRKIIRVIPLRYHRVFYEITGEINEQLGAYLRGIIIVSLAVGISTYLGFLFLGLDFPLVLGVINGVTNLIPYVGPFLGAAPAVLVALFSSPALALKVVILIIAVQQLESQFLSPLVLGRSINFHPLAVIFALLLGGKLFGFLGLLLALPAAVILRILAKHAWRFLIKQFS